MIDIKTKVKLGGMLQTVHVKGNDGSNPVLLFLHGGPGVTNRHTVMTEHTDLMDSFTLAAWDQRGTAGSYSGAAKEDLTIDRLTEDAYELVCWLCERFGKEKIFVIGGSWGSLLGIDLLKKHPERIAAFVGFGQFVCGHRNELISWEYTLAEAAKAGDAKAVKELRQVGPPADGMYKGGYAGMMKQRNLMMKYGGYSQSSAKRSYWDALVKPVLLSGEYTLSDITGYLKGYKFVLNAMWPEIGKVDFTKTHTKFGSPVFIFDGRHDMNTPSELAAEWFEMIEAPVKELVWFEESGHNPMTDEGKAFKALLKEKLLGIAREEEL